MKWHHTDPWQRPQHEERPAYSAEAKQLTEQPAKAGMPLPCSTIDDSRLLMTAWV